MYRSRWWKSKEKHWVSLFLDRNRLVYYDLLGIECTSQEILNKIRDKSITHNTIRIQSDDSVMCAFYCIAFTECMLSGKTLLDYINLFSPNEYNMNNKIIYKYFKDKYVKSQV